MQAANTTEQSQIQMTLNGSFEGAARIRLVSAAMTDDDAPVSWMTLEKGAAVFASDDKEVGQVGRVVADRQKDIFSGVTLSGGLFGTERFVPAELIADMGPDGVRLSIAEDQVEGLEPYQG